MLGSMSEGARSQRECTQLSPATASRINRCVPSHADRPGKQDVRSEPVAPLSNCLGLSSASSSAAKFERGA